MVSHADSEAQNLLALHTFGLRLQEWHRPLFVLVARTGQPWPCQLEVSQSPENSANLPPQWHLATIFDGYEYTGSLGLVELLHQAATLVILVCGKRPGLVLEVLITPEILCANAAAVDESMAQAAQPSEGWLQRLRAGYTPTFVVPPWADPKSWVDPKFSPGSIQT